MITIIKKGKPIKCKCNICKTVFKVEPEDIDTAFGISRGIVNCPVCEKTLWI